MEDRLVWLLKCFELNARVFQAGAICDQYDNDGQDGLGYIHVLRRGKLLLDTAGRARQLLDKPGLLFYMNPARHSFRPQGESVDIVCASFTFGASHSNPLTRALPEMIALELADVPLLNDSLKVLFKEAEEQHCGKQAILDRQMEVIIILLLRDLMDQERLKLGLLAGLADKKLRKAINAMHAQPGHNWSLEELAETAGMSRARFAVNFKNIVGVTPGNYLTEWRLSIAQSLLSKGKSIQYVSDAVGYRSAGTFTRAFTSHLGVSPSRWKKKHLA